MKITAIYTYLVRPRWCFLEIETDEGYSGWGEPVLEGHCGAVKACVEEMKEYLIGKDPQNIEDIWNVLYRAGFYRGGGVMMSAIAGIDQALWDIKGKYFGVPVYQLMGGACRERMRVYSWIGGDRPKDVGMAAKEKQDQGFTAVKMNAAEDPLELPLTFMGVSTNLWQKYWQKNWKSSILCFWKNRYYVKIWKRFEK